MLQQFLIIFFVLAIILVVLMFLIKEILLPIMRFENQASLTVGLYEEMFKSIVEGDDECDENNHEGDILIIMFGGAIFDNVNDAIEDYEGLVYETIEDYQKISWFADNIMQLAIYKEQLENIISKIRLYKWKNPK